MLHSSLVSFKIQSHFICVDFEFSYARRLVKQLVKNCSMRIRCMHGEAYCEDSRPRSLMGSPESICVENFTETLSSSLYYNLSQGHYWRNHNVHLRIVSLVSTDNVSRSRRRSVSPFKGSRNLRPRELIGFLERKNRHHRYHGRNDSTKMKDFALLQVDFPGLATFREDGMNVGLELYASVSCKTSFRFQRYI